MPGVGSHAAGGVRGEQKLISSFQSLHSRGVSSHCSPASSRLFGGLAFLGSACYLIFFSYSCSFNFKCYIYLLIYLCVEGHVTQPRRWGQSTIL